MELILAHASLLSFNGSDRKRGNLSAKKKEKNILSISVSSKELVKLTVNGSKKAGVSRLKTSRDDDRTESVGSHWRPFLLF